MNEKTPTEAGVVTYTKNDIILLEDSTFSTFSTHSIMHRFFYTSCIIVESVERVELVENNK